MRRRTFLGLVAAGATAGCSGSDDPPTTTTQKRETETMDGEPGEATRSRHTYGDDPSQYGDLLLPAGTPRGVVVVIHGGFWKSAYDADSLGLPLAEALAAEGWAAWNLEYRRVGTGPGGGGGAPETFDDVAAGIDRLASLDVDTSTVVTLGHSAGGHLATWAAGRGEHGWPEQVAVTHVISQAGVLDLRAAFVDDLGGGAVASLLGHAPTSADARFDPAQQLPLDVPVWCVHASDDTIVPLRQSVDYVVRAGATGARAELVEVDGDHFVVIDPTSPAWARQLAILDTIG
ncbi:MAG TPA: alpha/beta hydrolase [Nocardioides sp.]|nr:alpha/beta hydrolase [Nocardioides sp.]